MVTRLWFDRFTVDLCRGSITASGPEPQEGAPQRTEPLERIPDKSGVGIMPDLSSPERDLNWAHGFFLLEHLSP